MTDGIDDEVLERLEAEAKVADAEAEELTIAVESDIEQTETEVEELQAEIEEKESEIESLRDEKDSEVEELQSKIEEKEEELDTMSEHVDSMKETYAEELAAESPAMDADDYLDRFEFEELAEKHGEAFDGSSPAPSSGDPGAGFQSAGNEGGDGGTETEELSAKAKAAVEQFSARGGVWEEMAEDIKENGLGEVRKADESPNEDFF